MILPGQQKVFTKFLCLICDWDNTGIKIYPKIMACERKLDILQDEYFQKTLLDSPKNI